MYRTLCKLPGSLRIALTRPSASLHAMHGCRHARDCCAQTSCQRGDSSRPNRPPRPHRAMETLRVARGACLCLLLLIAGVDGRDAGDASHTLSAQRPDWKDYAAMARWLVHSSSWGVLSTLEHGTGLPMGGVVSHSDGVDPSWTQHSTAAAGEAAGAAAATAAATAAGTAGAATSPSSTHLPLGLVASRKVLSSGTRTPAVSPLVTDPGSRSGMAQHTAGHSLVQSKTWPPCTGRLFFYMTSMDFSCANVLASPASAFTVTESQLPGGCHGTDPEDPTCAKVTLVGHTVALEEEAERQLAQAALFSRHPDMQSWPADHHWQFFELKVTEARLLDWYGGLHVIPAAQYYSASLDS
ncbi:pyridoxamine 5'-phosphate oxidase-domain-containing protein [Haematococcus lacustris]